MGNRRAEIASRDAIFLAHSTIENRLCLTKTPGNPALRSHPDMEQSEERRTVMDDYPR